MEQQTKEPFQIKWPGATLIIFLVILIVGYFIARSYSQYEETNYNVSKTIDESKETQGQLKKLIDDYPNNDNTVKKESAISGVKTYTQIFIFSGNGAKKSEPFNIQGDRFKITYDCKGDPNITLCTAFVYKTGSVLPQGIMNSPSATKDETIIYTSMAGKGEYYIDANVIGNFTMTVYDYK